MPAGTFRDASVRDSRHMVIGRKNRRAARKPRVARAVAAKNVEAALDALELLEFAWHDCYAESSPPDDVVDDILLLSQGSLAKLVSACLLAVTDWRDLRLVADDLRSRP